MLCSLISNCLQKKETPQGLYVNTFYIIKSYTPNQKYDFHHTDSGNILDK